ncbi:RNA polymerase sigma factor [Paractinoplanes atraurantiacus]|uniref:RNA polymerase sigma factor n=1 Tax=Paractinoplanes atraurantiacus TaxID=1036182 RepID=A0A285GZJ5_9ACTN|nr:sigma-70 family RNA polymerase sigma factor [Actinoplanes atraurantiacus]SNY28888.1 RNA polymerase sigma-70 factor, ECF subfamily [Actinoplanes atraurantiacus]
MTVVAQRTPVDEEARLNAARASFALAQRHQAGDREAFADIYRIHYPAVLRYMEKRVQKRHLAEDLAQDVFVKALRRLGTFEWRERPIAAWLMTIARNRIADYWKSAGYHLEVLSDTAMDGAASPGGGLMEPTLADDPETTAITTLVREQLFALMHELTAGQAEVLVLRFFDGMSVAEAAAELGIHANACKALQYRAVRALAAAGGKSLAAAR